jgi:glycerol-3-phosphate dehydrogenase (NAD(P)+)
MCAITVLGDGGWGTTLAIVLAQKGFAVNLWGAFSRDIERMRTTRINAQFLPGVRIPRAVNLTDQLGVIESTKAVIVAVPSLYVRDVLTKAKQYDIRKTVFLSAAKGLERDTFLRMSQVIEECLGKVAVAVLSGPTIAHEVAHGVPTAAVVAAEDHRLARYFQDMLITERFRIYTHTAVVGVALGGGLKNIVAIACGITDGLGFGTNAKAAIVSRGLAEMVRLGKRLGARERTFSGISGLGDLVTTCISPHSRNRYVGVQMAKGKTISAVLKTMKMVAEGVYTVESTYRLAKRLRVDMPITNEVFAVVYRKKSPLAAVRDLMSRSRKRE